MATPINPSQEEFFGSYNVPWSPEFHDQAPLNTVRKPPKLGLAEVKEVQYKVQDIIFKFANLRYFTDKEIRNYYGNGFLLNLWDRTLGFCFLEPDDCTFELVNQIQALLAKEYPLWRVRIPGTNPSTAILIYPESIRFGSLDPNINPKDAFDQIIQMETALSNKPPILAEQRKEIRESLATILSGEEIKHPIVCGQFDNNEGDYSKAAIWILSPRKFYSIHVFYPDGVGQGGFYNVKPDGDFGYHVDKKSPYWIQIFIFPISNHPKSLKIKLHSLESEDSEIEILL
jgi:hypothetical protein